MTFPEVDVLIPAYNAEKTIQSALRSIQNQSVQNVRIIVVNDGSTDSTRRLVETAQQSDPRIVLLNKENGGIVDALNTGLSQCQAEFIARHDADDIAYEDRFKVQLEHLSRHPNCVAVSGAARHIGEAGQQLGSITTFGDPAGADPERIPSRQPYLMHPFLMVRRPAMQAAGGYRYAHHAEDTDLYWRLQELGELHNLRDILGEYRYSVASISSRSVLNGRLSAINSELGAISAQRRKRGEADLDFPKTRIAAFIEAKTSEGMLAVASKTLTLEETNYLAGAFAAKLLESCTYRPYVLDAQDCEFVTKALGRIGRLLSRSETKNLTRARARVAAKILRQGRLRSFWSIMVPQGLPRTAFEFVLIAVPKEFELHARQTLYGLRRRLGRA